MRVEAAILNLSLSIQRINQINSRADAVGGNTATNKDVVFESNYGTRSMYAVCNE